MGLIISDINRGRTHSVNVTFKVNKIAVDITGYTFNFMAKASISDADSAAVIDKSGTISDAANGVFNISLTPTDTNIPAGRYFYEVTATNGTAVYTVEKDQMKVYEPVDQP